jgi:16S rRNA G966 N2-methylase RsmD
LASRGAEQLTIVEKDKTMLDFIKKNIEFLKIENAMTIQMDVFQFLATCNQQYDIIFAGPPYALNTIDDLPKIIVEKKLISPKGYFILEHTPRNDYKTFKGYSFQRNYGATIFSFFECI